MAQFDLSIEQLEAYLDACAADGQQAGVAYDSHECPLARAYKRTHPEAHLHVHAQDVFLYDGSVSLTLSLAAWQAAFIAMLDGKHGHERFEACTVREASAVLERVSHMPPAELAQYGREPIAPPPRSTSRGDLPPAELSLNADAVFCLDDPGRS